MMSGGDQTVVAAAHGRRTPFLSIVTATYNSARTVRDTLESVRQQTFQDFEHIVVDGGSTDGTVDILKEYGSAVRWISEPDRGIYDAMNKGIAMSRGHWIHLLNSDDFYASNNVLNQIVPKLVPDALNYADLIRLNADGSRFNQSYRYRKWPLYLSAFLPHPSLLVSAEQYRAAGLYDASFRIAADHDLILRLLDRYPANHIKVEMTVMRQSGVSATNLDLTMDEFGRVLRKHNVPSILIGILMGVRRVWWKARSA
ncbi:glycosyltransferase family 2 protein [Bradyrhizobium genomosp. III]|uniref:glycosyltransferase family 2 protein n=1 Tax=Bradyrhizobium genomosp. III TaxID=2683271 RepID=UPI0004B68E82|nr:glycosyltransferase family 2 protein [Bradyrhizobium sp. CCBAU 15635]